MGVKIDLEEIREPHSEQVNMEQDSELPLDGKQVVMSSRSIGELLFGKDPN